MSRYVYIGARPVSLAGRGASILLRPHAEVELGDEFEGSQAFNVLVAKGLLRMVRDSSGDVQSVARGSAGGPGGEVAQEIVDPSVEVEVSDDEVTDKIEIPRPLVDEIFADDEHAPSEAERAGDKKRSRRKRRKSRE